ncbi:MULTISPECIES: ankyrin repeat domain-containing protein [unclassified Nocardioides]|uniref:ankyrin repeat domain-containing protein n=1 Tax=unclassified Nocardioides TaxID=2615069 RepID=UPI001E5A25AB|nr:MULTISPECIES: ankyrin repeat domain-containing protein [unclassified Nocardioides]
MSEPTEEMIKVALELFDAARDGQTARVLAYVDAGVPVDLTDHQGNTLLLLAAYHGHASLVDGLAERGAGVDTANDRDQVAIAGALFKGYDDVTAVLLRHGASLDVGTPTGRDAAEMFQRALPESR